MKRLAGKLAKRAAKSAVKRTAKFTVKRIGTPVWVWPVFWLSVKMARNKRVQHAGKKVINLVVAKGH